MTRRTRLFCSPTMLVESFQSAGIRQQSSPEGYSPEFQVCLPYRGLFVWHVGDDEVVADANQVLFVSGGEAYRLSEPLPYGYAELIVTPAPGLLAEVANTHEASLASHPLFRRRSRRADLLVQSLGARLHRAVNRDASDDLCVEELVITMLRGALAPGDTRPLPSRPTRRLIRRTKEFVEANLAAPLRLSQIANAVEASPAYLTNVFRLAEGVPLHRYVVQLRLARALVELPHANDLTTLAFELGFSSHSHFAAAFRRAFACTPSAFRQLTRRTQQQHVA